MLYVLALRDVIGAWWHFPIGGWRHPLAVYRAALDGRRTEARRCR